MPMPDNESKYEKQLRWTREEERHKINWITKRLSWLLLSQSFLITASIMAQCAWNWSGGFYFGVDKSDGWQCAFPLFHCNIYPFW